jgi:hypothetical protein
MFVLLCHHSALGVDGPGQERPNRKSDGTLDAVAIFLIDEL